jgi:subtilisin family serine protease
MHLRVVSVVWLVSGIAVVGCNRPDEEMVIAERRALSQTLPERYIVVLDDGVSDPDAVQTALLRAAGGTAHHSYRYALRGFSATLPAAAAAALARNPNVAHVEPDGEAWASLSWGLDRIDQRGLPLDGAYSPAGLGTGVTAFVVDTGINFGHAELGGRATAGYDAFGADGGDCNGHGTHVAGTIGGATFGVARAVSLVAVRVLDCAGSGSWSGVIAGLDYIAGRKRDNPTLLAVANMSLGGGRSTAVNAAVRRVTEAGVPVIVAAGNEAKAGSPRGDACTYSPSSEPTALTVGATDANDARAPWSNWGSCVDLFAPGVAISSAWIGSNTADNTISGTSMASPHACGVAALYLETHPAASSAEVHDALKARATQGIVSGALSAENDLLYADVGDTCGSCAPPPACGDGVCNGTETCSSCTTDCGVCACKADGQKCSTGGECCSGSCAGPRKNLTCR